MRGCSPSERRYVYANSLSYFRRSRTSCRGPRARLSLLLVTTGFTLAVLAFPAKAEALEPVNVEIAARAGYATSNLGPLGFGIGGRGGISVLSFYAGIDFIDYLGATSPCNSCSAPPGVPLPNRTQSAVLHGFEAGYSFKVSLVTIRPQLGLGNFRLSSALGDVVPSTSNYFYLEPGVVGLVSIGMFFVGADIGALFPPKGPELALTVHGQIGLTF